MHRFRIELVAIAFLLLAPSVSFAAGSEASVSGMVRDTQGVAQMGALVQILRADASIVSSVYTDISGHYVIPHLQPGRYRIKASAALFTPAIRSSLRVPAGTRAVVDLTLTTLFESTAWLPAERRRADEPTDEWKWTLRSAANRPILRLTADDEDGSVVFVSSSASEVNRPVQHASETLTSGAGGFGQAGLRHRFAIDQVYEDGSEVILRADLGSELSPTGKAPATGFDAGYERQLGFAGAARMVASFQSHPEMLGTGGTEGLQSIRLATAQRTRMGDLVDLEYGSSISALHIDGYGVSMSPFVRITVHPLPGWSAGYRMATARDLQSYSSLDALLEETPVATMSSNRLLIEKGNHQEFQITRTDGRGMVEVAVYHDTIDNPVIAGMGLLASGDVQNPGVQGLMGDSASESFRLSAPTYSAQGVRILISEPLTPALASAVSFSTGSALSTSGLGAITLDQASAGLHTRTGQTAAVALKGRVLHTGTMLRAAYRWQPRSMLTAVDPYAAFSDQAFLSFYLAQPIRCGGMLPTGLSAVVDVTNLLSQGYQPFLSDDGKTIFLAQSPRAVQAGLSYTF